MSFMLAARFARRELRAGLSGFRILIACLALGVAAIAAVGSVRSALVAGLSSEGATLLGGDAEAEFTYRFAEPSERSWLDSISQEVSEVVDFRSMIVVERGQGQDYSLTQIKAVDTAYPLMGRVILEDNVNFGDALARKNGTDGLVLERVLADRLGLELGDILMIGIKSFRLGGILQSAPDSASDGFGLGPRTIVYKSSLEGAGLLEPGTLFSTKYRLKLIDGIDLETLSLDAKNRFENTGLRWRDARNAAPGISEFVDRLAIFLILVGLAGLAVGGIGVSSAVRSYLATKTTVIATLRSLGATNAVIFQTYFLQIAALSCLGIILGLALGSGIPLIFAPLIEAALPFPIRIELFVQPLIEASIYGMLTASIFALWPLAQAENIGAATLFRDIGDQARTLPNRRYLVITAILLTLLLASASWFTGALKLTLWMGIGILSALSLLSFSAFLLQKAARKSAPLARGHAVWHWALTAIGGTKGDAAPVVLALGLGLSVLAAVGQIDGNLRSAIVRDLPQVAPSYFFVDIQKSQMPEFREILASESGVSQVDEAPMLRGIITKINGENAKIVAGDHWVLQGDRGVTYSETPRNSADITEGSWWPKGYNGPPQISFSAQAGAEMGLKLGDEMTVNIMGRDITGTITSFRTVDFSTAGIGFVLAMNPSALDAAPHSFIATVYADSASEAQILRSLASVFPNITAIPVRDVIGRVVVLLGSIAAATSYGAAAALVTGFLVLIGAASSGAGARRYEAAILKTLGASRRGILISFALRAMILGAAAGLVALGVGAVGGWAVCSYVLDTDFAVIWPNALAIVGLGILANILAGLAFALGALNAAPAQVLRNQD
ncbi:MAG: FtsX-like permease family protein [Paracoccaceae bacterium]|nr:FtsX-like permease family protein [Paracoccaceae bacterium]